MLVAWLVSAAWAADCGAVVDARVHTPDGPRDGWTVRWDADGRLDAVGPEVSTAGCTVVHTGGEVTPGLVAVPTQLGLVEIELEASTRDDRGAGDPVRAAFAAAEGYNPRSTAIPVSRSGGITSTITVPTQGFVSGQAAWARLVPAAPDTWPVEDPRVAVRVDLGALGSTGAGIARLGELLDDAALFQRGRLDARRHELSGLSASAADLRALSSVLDGEDPLLIRADRASDLQAVARFATDRGLRVVVEGCAEGAWVAATLAEAGISCIVDPLVYGAGSPDQVHGGPDTAARLHAAGVRIALTASETHNARTLRVVAGNAVRGGLPHVAAVQAITQAPAEAFGLDDVGRIAPGARADLAIFDGDPLQIGSDLLFVVFDGRAGVPRTRQDVLTEAWQDLDVPAWRR